MHLAVWCFKNDRGWWTTMMCNVKVCQWYYKVIQNHMRIMFLCRHICEGENPYQGDPREDLQQRYQVVSIPQVFVQVCDVLPHLGNKKAGWGGREEKEETKEEKVNTPLQSSLCWLNTVDICQTACPTAGGAGDSGCRGDREEAPAVWPLVCVAMTLPLEWLYWRGWKGWDVTWRRLLLTRWLSSRISISAALAWKWNAWWGVTVTVLGLWSVDPAVMN